MRIALIISLFAVGRLLAQQSATDSIASDTGKAREPVLEGREVSGKAKDPAGAERVLDRAELGQVQTLADALAKIPGVEIRRTGGLGGYSEISLRQCPSEQVRVVLDGVMVQDNGSSTVDLGMFLPDGLERVEILQGAGIGGDGRPELILISRRAWNKAGVSGTLGSFGERQLSGWWSGDSGTTSLAGWYATSRDDWPILWNGGLTFKPKDTIVTLPNSDFTGWGGTGAWRPLPRLQFSFRADGSEQGVSGLYVAHPDARWDRRSLQGSLESKGQGEWDWPVDAQVRWDESEWHDSGSSVDYRSNRESHLEGWNGSGSAGLVRDAKDWTDLWSRLELGGQTSKGTTTTPGLVHLTPDAQRLEGTFSAGWKGQDGAGVFGASATGLVQSTRNARDFEPNSLGEIGSSSDSTWISLAMSASMRAWVRSPDGIWQAWVGAGMDQKAPDFFELYGDNGLTLENLSLQPEKSWTSEFGAAWAPKPFKIQMVPWAGLYRDPIRRQILGASQLSQFRNDSGYSAVGLDADAEAGSSWGDLDATVGWSRTWLRSVYASYRGKELDYMPQWRWNVLARTAAWEGFSGEGSMDGACGYWTSQLNTPDSWVPGHVLYGLGISWRLGRFVLFFQAQNLTNVQFQEFQDAPLSGRSFRAKLDIDLSPTRPTKEKT